MLSFVKLQEALSDGGLEIWVGLINCLCLEVINSVGLPGAQGGMGPPLRKGLARSLPLPTKLEPAMSVQRYPLVISHSLHLKWWYLTNISYSFFSFLFFFHFCSLKFVFLRFVTGHPESSSSRSARRGCRGSCSPS